MPPHTTDLVIKGLGMKIKHDLTFDFLEDKKKGISIKNWAKIEKKVNLMKFNFKQNLYSIKS